MLLEIIFFKFPYISLFLMIFLPLVYLNKKLLSKKIGIIKPFRQTYLPAGRRVGLKSRKNGAMLELVDKRVSKTRGCIDREGPSPSRATF